MGGVITELPFTKQPPLANVVGSGETAVHLPHIVEADGSAELVAEQLSAATSEPVAHVTKPLIPLVVEQPVPLPTPPAPLQKGMEFVLDLKSLGFPKKSQRLVKSPKPLPPVL